MGTLERKDVVFLDLVTVHLPGMILIVLHTAPKSDALPDKRVVGEAVLCAKMDRFLEREFVTHGTQGSVAVLEVALVLAFVCLDDIVQDEYHV